MAFAAPHDAAGVSDISSSEFKLSLTKLVYEHFAAGR
jgi:hypothetical protein